MAYTAATLCYQLGSISVDPTGALTMSAMVMIVSTGMFAALVFYGRRRVPRLIPLVNLET
jgi:hypothetical protein